jgi:hypothetical protein
MRKLFGKPILPLHDAQELRERMERAEQRFRDLTEEDQVLYLLARQISWVFGQMESDQAKEDTARRLITESHGPKFADRILADSELRKKIGLDRPQKALDKSALATTVASDD